MNTLPFATALIAGLIHALEADHVAAVTTFVSRRPHPLRALGFGIRWGLGHSAALLVAGGLLIALGLELPVPLVEALELGVGAMLIGLGTWTLRTSPGRDAGDHEAHGPGVGAGSTWVGAAHGVAGTAGFLAIVPAVMLASPWSAGGYLVLFGVGTIAAMGGYAFVAGALFHRAGVAAPGLAEALRIGAAIASIGIGSLWLWRGLG